MRMQYQSNNQSSSQSKPFAKTLTIVWTALITLIISITIIAGAYAHNGEEHNDPSVHPQPAFTDQTVIVGVFSQPTAFAFAPDENGKTSSSSRVFVAEKEGVVKTFDNISDLTPTIFIDLTSEVRTDAPAYTDLGMVGLAVDPQWPTRPYIYVGYTLKSGVSGSSAPGGRLERLTATFNASGHPILANRTTLLESWCQLGQSHSVDDIQFGLDGYLYLTAGDMARYNAIDIGLNQTVCPDPAGEGGALRSQVIINSEGNVSLHGKMLRLDPDTGEAAPDNWLVTNNLGIDSPLDDKIVAYGFRNPFRFSIAPSGTPAEGKMFIGDVGWGTYEEINLVDNPTEEPPNFGWPCYEGPIKTNSYSTASLAICENLYSQNPINPTPFFSYNRAGGGGAIGAVAYYYGGSYDKGFDGALFYGDYAQASITVIYPDEDGFPDPNETALVSTGVIPVDMEQGPDGEIYYLSYSATGTGIHRLRYVGAPVADLQANATSGAVPLMVQFDASASTHTGTETNLTYEWDLDGDGLFDDSTDVAPAYTYNAKGSYLVRLRVSDGTYTDVKEITISAANAPPVITIEGIWVNGAYCTGLDCIFQIGDAITVNASAIDPDTGNILPPEALTWQLIQNHCPYSYSTCHEHSGTPVSNQTSISFIVDDHEYPWSLQVKVSANDFVELQWWDENWEFRQPFTFEASTITEDVNEFIFPIIIDSSNFDYSSAKADGSDIRIIDENEAELPYEIEIWNPSGQSVIWTKIPTLNSYSTHQRIYLYYGNSIATDKQNATSVWGNKFKAVYHGNINGVQAVDSTANNQSATVNGPVTSTISNIANTFIFSNLSYLNTGIATAFNNTSWTISYRAKSNGNCTVLGNLVIREWTYRSYSGGTSLGQAECELFVIQTINSGGGTITPDVFKGGIESKLTAGEWHDIAITYDINSLRIKTYFDGELVGDYLTGGIPTDPALPFTIGGQPFAETYSFAGSIDEVRFEFDTKSDAWYYAQKLGNTNALLNLESLESKNAVGLITTETVELFPQSAPLEILSSPISVNASVQEYSYITPYSGNWSIGSEVTFAFPAQVEYNNLTYVFMNTTLGTQNTILHTITSAGFNVTAYYELQPVWLTVNTAPAGTTILEGNTELGVTNENGTLMLSMSPGSHELTAVKSGYKAVTESVIIVSETPRDWNVTLSKKSTSSGGGGGGGGGGSSSSYIPPLQNTVQNTESKESTENSDDLASSGSAQCTPNWNCGEWSACEDGARKRMCVDENNCSEDAVNTESCDEESVMNSNQGLNEEESQSQNTLQESQWTTITGATIGIVQSTGGKISMGIILLLIIGLGINFFIRRFRK